MLPVSLDRGYSGVYVFHNRSQGSFDMGIESAFPRSAGSTHRRSMLPLTPAHFTV